MSLFPEKEGMYTGIPGDFTGCVKYPKFVAGIIFIQD
jgi:hypothetical protein